MKSLVIYYSMDGHTRLIADIIAKEVGGDIFELKTVKPSAGKSGFAKFFLGGMHASSNQKPPLQKPLPELKSYELVFIGTPVWASNNVPAINTFIAGNDLAGKKVMLFSSSASGDADKCFFRLKSRLSGSKIIGDISFKEPTAEDRYALASKIKAWISAAGV